MNIVVTAAAAFAVGLGALAGVQALGLISVKQYLMSDAARRPVMPEMKPAYKFDTGKIGSVIPKMPPIDTKAGERAALSAINRQIDLNIRAGNNIPVPKKYPGMR
jgi:hypothetical protein